MYGLKYLDNAEARSLVFWVPCSNLTSDKFKNHAFFMCSMYKIIMIICNYVWICVWDSRFNFYLIYSPISTFHTHTKCLIFFSAFWHYKKTKNKQIKINYNFLNCVYLLHILVITTRRIFFKSSLVKAS